MANIKSQKKRNRQNEKRRIKNSRVKSSIRTSVKKVFSLINTKEGADATQAEAQFKSFVKIIDSAARKGVLHKNTAARKKSRLAKQIQAFKGQQTA